MKEFSKNFQWELPIAETLAIVAFRYFSPVYTVAMPPVRS
jgi:hypothetical protein